MYENLDQLKDARPNMSVSQDSAWVEAANHQTRIAKTIVDEFEKNGFLAWVKKSQPGHYPLTVTAQNWIPVEENDKFKVTARAEFSITIEVDPYLEHPVLFKVSCQGHKKSFQREHWAMSDSEIAEIVRFLIEGGKIPKFFKSGPSGGIAILAAILPPVAFFLWLSREKNELVKYARRNYLAAGFLLGLLGLVAAVVGFIMVSVEGEYGDTAPGTMVLFVGVILLLLAFFVSSRRKQYTATPKLPERAPRLEFMVDSWSVSVPSAQGRFEALKRRIHDKMLNLDPNIKADLEVHQAYTPLGFEERERLVLSKGQGTLHLHIYPFSTDAFIGWENYLNWAKWSEKSTGLTTIKGGKKILFRSVQTQIHVPSSFELMELNSLTEMAHRVITDEIKAYLNEQELEAELDFKIIRGDRTGALDAEGKRDFKGNQIRTK